MPGAHADVGAEPLLVNVAYNKGRARRLHGAMHALNEDLGSQVKAGSLSRDTPRWRNWKRWIDNYGRWFGSIPEGMFTGAIHGWGTGGVAAMLDSYEREMVDWRNWYGRNFRVPPTGMFNPAGTEAGRPPGEGALIPREVPAWVWGGLVVAGLLAAANLVTGIRR